ncbi:MAG: hypothetical protein AAF891_03185 [Pseudomonadota bacterium]
MGEYIWYDAGRDRFLGFFFLWAGSCYKLDRDAAQTPSVVVEGLNNKNETEFRIVALI